ncbi:hypothetical protein BGW38_010496 [Lunasporangiospora selenospora]|uniref:Uncharacterized protein n=1 Tax=Lunasporangiospora selenospora TaxID=979761 RepID=A0A9P6FWM5_9FUNG|nr:hypothetical protein BGW38_010496 [Lunasporangiospora selenospora]
MTHSHILVSEDPSQAWVIALMQHGGHAILLGIPGLVAIVAFLYRIRWFKLYRRKHNYGVTSLIYWPSQVFLGLACLSFVALVLSLLSSSDADSLGLNGLTVGATLMLGAWITGILLNREEHLYETRSSDNLVLYYLTSLTTIAMSLYAIYIVDEAHDEVDTGAGSFSFHVINSVPSRFLALSALFLFLGLVVEIWPRYETRVQIESRKEEKLCPYDQASLISRWTFQFVQPVLRIGTERALKGSDIEGTDPAFLRTHVNYERLSALWDKKVAHAQAEAQKNKAPLKPPSLLFTIAAAYKGRLFKTMFYRVIGSLLIFVPPALFTQLLLFLQEHWTAKRDGTVPPPLRLGLLICVITFLATMSTTLLVAYGLQGILEVGMSARGACIAMIYRKAIKLSPQARQKSTLGEITNHMAVDAEKILGAGSFVPLIITIPIELALSMFMLYRLLGWSFFAGVIVFVIVTPIQAKMGEFLTTFQDKKLEAMDVRLRLMTEILSSIKIVKLYGWEDAFHEKVQALRNKELRSLKLLATIRSLLTIVFSSVGLLMALAAFGVYASVGGPNWTPGKMSVDVIFVSITLFGLMSKPLGMFTHVVSMTISLSVATRRIQGFLLQEEIDPTVVQRYSRHVPSSSSSSSSNSKGRKSEAQAVVFENGTFAWEKTEEVSEPVSSSKTDERQPLLSGASNPLAAATPKRPVLSNINLQIPEGSLTAVVGRIGQGKSSLLSAIMGEMYKLQGAVKVYGDIAYVPQQAWIINATLKDNILFGKAFDQQLYDQVVFAAGLSPDLEMLPAGDQTEIGERGINLSGGQKQRVSLARAAYQDADVYLLDDPLSAVDAHVDQHLWENLLGPKGLLKNKTRILVTHGIHHLENVDQVVVLKDGMISETGSYKELINAGGAFRQLIRDFSVGKKKVLRRNSSKNSVPATESDNGEDSDRNTIVDEEAGAKDDDDENGELISEEKMEIGNACHIGTNLWLRHWVTETEAHNREGKQIPSAAYFLGGYGLLVVMYLIMDVAVNYISEVVCGIQGSIVLHERLLSRVLRLPMSMGRIVNRFSSDIDSIDIQLAEEFNDLFAFTAIIVGTLFVIAYSTPLFLLMIPPLMLAYLLIQNYYIKTTASVKRLQSVSKSPMYQHFSESLAGVSSIRVMKGFKEMFIQQNETCADRIVNRTNVYMALNRWLQVRLEGLGGVLVLAASVLAVLKAGQLDPTLVGLALSYALNMIGFMNYLVRTISEVQNLMVSVERVLEYSEKPTEAPVTTGVRLPENWPQHGKVVFKDYSTRYREGLDLVIKDVSFTVEPAQKIGIVGRTGAGKSSLTLALFRIIEAADSYWARTSDPSAQDHPIDSDMFRSETGGSIEIDGIDISTLGLRDLRQHLSIIPQDPTLFAGSLRENLDPFGEITDAEIWLALERAHLKDYVLTLSQGLLFEVAQNGENFSVGQRSLICLARALLRKTKILVLDEATAAVDVETDDLIQKTIRKEFKDRTILTIAHRIKTVMDSDKILVLDKGRVQEYEAPKTLLKRKNSLFYSLAQQAGEI